MKEGLKVRPTGLWTVLSMTESSVPASVFSAADLSTLPSFMLFLLLLPHQQIKSPQSLRGEITQHTLKDCPPPTQTSTINRPTNFHSSP